MGTDKIGKKVDVGDAAQQDEVPGAVRLNIEGAGIPLVTPAQSPGVQPATVDEDGDILPVPTAYLHSPKGKVNIESALATNANAIVEIREKGEVVGYKINMNYNNLASDSAQVITTGARDILKELCNYPGMHKGANAEVATYLRESLDNGEVRQGRRSALESILKTMLQSQQQVATEPTPSAPILTKPTSSTNVYDDILRNADTQPSMPRPTSSAVSTSKPKAAAVPPVAARRSPHAITSAPPDSGGYHFFKSEPTPSPAATPERATYTPPVAVTPEAHGHDAVGAKLFDEHVPSVPPVTAVQPSQATASPSISPVKIAQPESTTPPALVAMPGTSLEFDAKLLEQRARANNVVIKGLRKVPAASLEQVNETALKLAGIGCLDSNTSKTIPVVTSNIAESTLPNLASVAKNLLFLASDRYLEILDKNPENAPVGLSAFQENITNVARSLMKRNGGSAGAR